MRVVTKQALIATVAERFRDAHQRRGEWTTPPDGRDAPATYAQLSALPANVDEDAVTAVVGDNRYTANICDECGEDRTVTVILGEEIHHAIDFKAICLNCLKQAKRLAAAAK